MGRLMMVGIGLVCRYGEGAGVRLEGVMEGELEV